MTDEFHYLRSTIQREVKRAAGRVEQVEVSVRSCCDGWEAVELKTFRTHLTLAERRSEVWSMWRRVPGDL